MENWEGFHHENSLNYYSISIFKLSDYTTLWSNQMSLGNSIEDAFIVNILQHAQYKSYMDQKENVLCYTSHSYISTNDNIKDEGLSISR